MCYGSESVGYDSTIQNKRLKKEQSQRRDVALSQIDGEPCVTYQKGIMATVALVTNDNYCHSQRNPYQPPQKWEKNT